MAEPMHNFTPRAQQALALARKEADRFNHNYVGTEHLLLGLLILGSGLAVHVLQKMGLDVETVRRAVEKETSASPRDSSASNVPYTPRVKKVLALAGKEAKVLNHAYIGTEHILLGLLREGEGVAVRVLKSLNVDIEQCRNQILAVLGSNFSSEGVSPVAEFARSLGKYPPPPRKDSAIWPWLIAVGLMSLAGAVGVLPVSTYRQGLVIMGLMLLAMGLRMGLRAKYPPRAPRTSFAPLADFSPQSQQILALARKEADRYHHSYIGTEHVLLGLMDLDDCEAVKVLHKTGLDFTAVRTAIERQVGSGPESKPAGNVPYTPRVKKVLALANKEAKLLNHAYIGTEHILLGLVREGEGIAARVLAKLHLDYEVLRKLCAAS